MHFRWHMIILGLHVHFLIVYGNLDCVCLLVVWVCVCPFVAYGRLGFVCYFGSLLYSLDT